MPEHNLQSIAFPTLDEPQISKPAQCPTATPKVYRDGQTLFAIGDRDFKFFIVKSGEIEIVDHSGDEPKTVTVHRKGQFTGEISHLTGNPAVVSAVARGDTEVYEVSGRSEEHTSELQSRLHLVCRLLLEKKNINDVNAHL